MNKRYQVKIYDKDGTYKKTIKENEILSDFNFTLNINGGQGNFNLLLNNDFNNKDIVESDFVKVSLYDDNFKEGTLIYTGIVEEINRLFKESENKLELVCMGLVSMLTRFYFKDGSDYVFNKNKDAGDIVKDVITYFNSVFPGNWINDSGVKTVGSSVNIDFGYDTCLDAIIKSSDVSGYYFYICSDGTVTFDTKPTTNTHLLTALKDVQNIEINLDSGEIINKVIVDYDGGTVTSESISSQNTYGLFEKHCSKGEIKDEATAQAFADSSINLNKDRKQKIELEVNNRYIIESFKPGNTVKLRNINFTIDLLQIVKIDLSSNLCKIYLDKIDSVGEILTK